MERYNEEMAFWKSQQSAARPQARRSGNNVAGNVVAAAYGIAQAVTMTGVGDFQPGQGGTFDQNWAESSLQAQQDRQSRDLDEGTRDSGYSAGWGGQTY